MVQAAQAGAAGGTVAYAHATLDRAEAFAAALTRDLARCAALERETAAVLAELAAFAAGSSSQAMLNRISNNGAYATL